ncbi:MAG: carbohydrate kinase family protein [Patescibacteria group bacterium]
MSSPTVLTIGSATRDVFLFSKLFKVMPMPGNPGVVAECVTLGSKIDVDELTIATGGGATNAAATFVNLGFATSLMARVGDDTNGRDILAELADRGINTSLVSVAKKEMTAYSTLLTAEGGERTVLVFRGASANFSEKDIKFSKIAADVVYLTSLGGNIALALGIAKACERKGSMLAWNPGGQELKSGRGLDPIRKLVAVLIVNLQEAQLLSGKPSTDPKVQCELLALPGQIVVITDGQNGAWARKDKSTWHCRTTGVASTSRTGAGDAFGSAFTAAIASNLSIEDALRLGTMNAEHVIQHIGAKAGILRAWPKENDLGAYRIRKV